MYPKNSLHPVSLKVSIETATFCVSNCTTISTKPQVYDSIKKALLDGFIPCVQCTPLLQNIDVPTSFQQILNESINLAIPLKKDYELKKQDIEPDKLRQWCKQHFDLTFHALQRIIKLNKIFKNTIIQSLATAKKNNPQIKNFNEDYFTLLPFFDEKEMADKTIVSVCRLNTPLGCMIACASKEGLCLLEFTDRKMLPTEFKDLSKRMNGVFVAHKNKHLLQLEKELKEYFEGKRTHFEVKLHTPSTEFRSKVWTFLKKIPYGTVSSYKNQAIKIGNFKAVRAVASANGHNRVAIVIPCHRVIGEDGNLTGYAGGLERKKWLLDFEKSNLA